MSAVIAVEDFPTFSREVERKAYDALAMLAAKRERKTIGDGEFLACMDTLAYAYGGILDADFMQLVDGFRDAVKKSSQASQIRVFYRTTDNALVALLKNTERGLLKVMRTDRAGAVTIAVKNFEKEDVPAQSVIEAFAKMEVSLISLGFDEFN